MIVGDLGGLGGLGVRWRVEGGGWRLWVERGRDGG